MQVGVYTDADFSVHVSLSPNVYRYWTPACKSKEEHKKKKSDNTKKTKNV